MKLLDFIVDNEDKAIISDDDSITFREILEISSSNQDVLDCLRGIKVSFAGNGSADLAVLLSILDGIASEILLVPTDFGSGQVESIESRADSSCRVSLENQRVVVDQLKVAPKNLASDTKWIVPTSGTTGLPKLVIHSLASLTKTLKRDCITGRYFCWGLSYEISRFAGLQVFLQSITTGASVCIPPDGCSVAEKVNFYIKHGANIISATPSFWRAALMVRNVDELDLRRITLGGEIADKNVLDALASKFSECKIVHIYASTEAGVGFTVQDCRPGFPIEYLEGAHGDVEIKVKGDKLFLKSNNSSDGYIDKGLIVDEDGFLDTGDLVEIVKDRVTFLGRASGLINVGGNKVYPEMVESILLNHVDVLDCKVYAKDNPIVGSLVCADVVTGLSASEFGVFKKNLINFCSDKLLSYQIPRFLNKVDSITKNSAGKIIR